MLKSQKESDTPVTHVKALNKKTKPLSASTQTLSKKYKDNASQAWKVNIKSGGVQTDSQSSNEDGTQTSVADGTGYYNLMDDVIMEEVEKENKKKAKNGR